MKHYKRNRELSHHILIDEDYWYGWNYEYDYYQEKCPCCHRIYCDCERVEYKYLGVDCESDFLNRRVYPRNSVSYKNERQIDMMSVYSKEILRDIKIDLVFGADRSNTIKNITNMK